MEFIDPKTDFAFKRIFGSKDSDHVLISFLNAALKLEGEYEIKSVEIKNPYQERHLPIEKQSIVDIFCADKRGVVYLVEMQVENVEGFANRIIYNAAKCYSGQLRSYLKSPKLNSPAYQVNHGNINHSLTGFRQPFIVFTMPRIV